MKREINEELVDVWATMISEKMEQRQSPPRKLMGSTSALGCP